MFTSSLKRRFRRSHVEVVQWTSRKCTKKRETAVTLKTKCSFEVVVVTVVVWLLKLPITVFRNEVKLNETIFDLKRFAEYYGLWRKHLESHGWVACYFCSQHRHLLAVNIILEPLLLFSEKRLSISPATESFSPLSHFLNGQATTKTSEWKKTPSPNSMLLPIHKCPGIRLSFEYTTTLLSGEGGEGRTGTATMLRKMLSKYTIFSTVLSKIVAWPRTFI